MNMFGMDPLVAHALGAVPDLQQQRQVQQALDRIVEEDQMRQQIQQASGGTVDPQGSSDIPLLTEGIQKGALDSELDDLEEAIRARRAVLEGTVTCPCCGEKGYEEPIDCTYCVDQGCEHSACIYPEAPDDKQRKQLATWHYENEDRKVAEQLAALKRELLGE